MKHGGELKKNSNESHYAFSHLEYSYVPSDMRDIATGEKVDPTTFGMLDQCPAK